MAKLAPLTAGELDHEIHTFRLSGRDHDADLRELHALLMRAAPVVRQPPIAALVAAAGLLGQLPSRVEDGLPPRPRTVFRLLRVGALDAAWMVLVDNATGLVDEPFTASTSSGATRTAWRLPLITRIEPPKIFADLPGFRDPRFNPPDDCYDITTGVRLRHQLDEIWIANGAATLGGWARLRSLATSPQEQVRVIAANGDAEVSVGARRRRRPDLVVGRGGRAERRAWAGWSAQVDLADPRLVDGNWSLSLEIDHCGVSRRDTLGAQLGELARLATVTVTQVGSRSVRWIVSGRHLELVVATGHDG
jgi:hypothetical protein